MGKLLANPLRPRMRFGSCGVGMRPIIFAVVALFAVNAQAQPAVRQDFEDCVVANTRTEFDTADAVLARVATSCQMSGTARVRGRGDAFYGDTLRYNVNTMRLSWTATINTMENALAGGNISPASPVFNAAAYNALTRDQRREVDRLGNFVFFFLQVGQPQADAVREYEASNAFGARTVVREVRGVRYSVALPAGGRTSGPIELASFSLPPERARDLIDHLDIEFQWAAQAPCAVCYRGGEVPRGGLARPTITNPNDVELRHRYVFGMLHGIRLIDRRTNEVIAEQPLGQGAR